MESRESLICAQRVVIEHGQELAVTDSDFFLELIRIQNNVVVALLADGVQSERIAIAEGRRIFAGADSVIRGDARIHRRGSGFGFRF